MMMEMNSNNDRRKESNDHSATGPLSDRGSCAEEPPAQMLSPSLSFTGVGNFPGSFMEQTSTSWEKKVKDARPLLPKAAFFIGDIRDGLPMVRTTEMTD